MRLLCPAKINLHLRVGPLRGDGFHPLLSWFCTTGLFDTLTLEQAGPVGSAPADSRYVSLSCDDPNLPTDGRNLVVKVGDAWAQESKQMAGSRVSPVQAVLHKRIPAGAGLGGGSSDGARALMGLNALWHTARAADDLSAFAARFGSDLSFFFFGPSSVCKSRGEIVQPVARPKPRWVLLVLPPIAMPTGEVYRKFDAMKLGRVEDVNIEPDWLAWSTLDAPSLLTRLVNDLEPPAFAISPELARLRDGLESKFFRPVRMSGSGSSLFTVYDTEEEARAAETFVRIATNARAEAVELAPDPVDALNNASPIE